MKLVIPGGSGQVGTALARAFHRDGHEVVVLSRQPAGNTPWRSIVWDARGGGDWEAEMEGADAVINLAGRSVNCRYTPGNCRAILESRVDSTRALGDALARCARPPRVWFQASTATLYAHRYDAPNDEERGILGGEEPGVPETWRFSIDVARAWEQAANASAARIPQTRLVLMRTAIVMSPQAGGAFDLLLRLVRFGLGGRSGDGRQFVSWIHEDDLVAALYRLLEDESFVGPVNLAAPEPLPNADFMRGLREAWGIPFGLPAARWMLEIGTFFLRTETELVLKSRRVVPGLLTRHGFSFQYPSWPEAARDLCARWRRERADSGKTKRRGNEPAPLL